MEEKLEEEEELIEEEDTYCKRPSKVSCIY